MKITKRQLRRIIKEAAGPSLESLFAKGAPYDNSDQLTIVIDDMTKQTPGLEKKIRKILGPLPSGDDDKGNFHYYIGKHLNLAARQWSLGAPEWVKYASDLIRQAGIEREFINYAPSVPIKWETPLTKQQIRAKAKGKGGTRRVPIDANTGTELAVDAMGPDDAVDSISGDATDPAFLRQLAGWLQQMDKNPAVQMIMFNMD
jgi:hypothetical protein